MKLINYSNSRYKKWGPRATVILVAVSALVTGMCLATALIVATHSQNTWAWIWLATMAFAFAVQTVEATIVALHYCPPSNDAERTKRIPDRA